jgi:quinol monooxygenase YgiN
MSLPVGVLVTYRPKKGKEARFFTLLKRHWPTLQRAGLVTATRPRIWRASDKRTRRAYFVEMFEWKDAKASDTAHRTPEVRAVWGPMEPLLETMELAVVKPVLLSFAAG